MSAFLIVQAAQGLQHFGVRRCIGDALLQIVDRQCIPIQFTPGFTSKYQGLRLEQGLSGQFNGFGGVVFRSYGIFAPHGIQSALVVRIRRGTVLAQCLFHIQQETVHPFHHVPCPGTSQITIHRRVHLDRLVEIVQRALRLFQTQERIAFEDKDPCILGRHRTDRAQDSDSDDQEEWSRTGCSSLHTAVPKVAGIDFSGHGVPVRWTLHRACGTTSKGAVRPAKN